MNNNNNNNIIICIYVCIYIYIVIYIYIYVYNYVYIYIYNYIYIYIYTHIFIYRVRTGDLQSTWRVSNLFLFRSASRVGLQRTMVKHGMLYYQVKYSIVQYSIVQYGIVQYRSAQRSLYAMKMAPWQGTSSLQSRGGSSRPRACKIRQYKDMDSIANNTYIYIYIILYYNII